MWFGVEARFEVGARLGLGLDWVTIRLRVGGGQRV